MTNKKQEEWRELCALVAEESDPHRLSELADELIRALDERKEELFKRGERRNAYTDNT
jgi:23S rRNA maturation mini-RNase III